MLRSVRTLLPANSACHCQRPGLFGATMMCYLRLVATVRTLRAFIRLLRANATLMALLLPVRLPATLSPLLRALRPASSTFCLVCPSRAHSAYCVASPAAACIYLARQPFQQAPLAPPFGGYPARPTAELTELAVIKEVKATPVELVQGLQTGQTKGRDCSGRRERTETRAW